ncbi:MAG: type II secretion system F family protein [Candidatus Eremiobacterota bacterium]
MEAKPQPLPHDWQPGSSRNLGRVPARRLAAGLSHLAALLRASVPVAACLTTLAEQEDHPSLKVAWRDVLLNVEMGRMLSGGMAAHPRVFPPEVVMLARAGEETGDLDGRLERAAQMVARQAAYQEKVLRAIWGPLFTAVVSLSVLFMLSRFVMPRFVDMYRSMDVTMPLITRVAVGIVSLVNHPTFPAVLLMGVALAMSVRSRFRSWAFQILLALPWTRPLVASFLCAQFCDTLACLYGNGIAISRALRLLATSAWEPTYGKMLERVAARIELDGHLAEAVVEEVPFFPACTGGMLSVGTEAGDLEMVLRSTQRLMDLETDSRLEIWLALIEPLLVAGLGIVLAGFFVAMLIPMYELVSKLGP